jgi:HAD superfamily hydrolase (TIGR01549 family)
LAAGAFALKTKAVLFDLGNTLVRMWVPEFVYHGVLGSLGISRSIERIKQALARTEEEFRDRKYRLLYGKISYRKYWNEWDSTVLKHLQIIADRKLVTEIQTRWFDYADCKVYPDVKPILTELRTRGLKTGMISTAYEEDITAISKKAGLPKDLFSVIIGANTIKKEKPHPDVFKYALRKLNVEPEGALFVGDSVDADYRGAEKVRMRAILIQRTENVTCNTQGLITINELKEIFNYIE